MNNHEENSISDQSPITDIESLRSLYSETAQMARTFLEWRHKVISLYLLSISAIFIFSGWLHDHTELRRILFVPFLLGAAISCTLALMDRINQRVLFDCYRIGNDIETEMRMTKGAIYSAIFTGYHQHLTYHKILRVIYWGSAFIFIVIALTLLFIPLK